MLLVQALESGMHNTLKNQLFRVTFFFFVASKVKIWLKSSLLQRKVLFSTFFSLKTFFCWSGGVLFSECVFSFKNSPPCLLLLKLVLKLKLLFRLKRKSDKILSTFIASNYPNTKFQFVISLINHYKNQESIKDST